MASVTTRFKVGIHEFEASGDAEFVSGQFHDAVERIKKEFRDVAIKSNYAEQTKLLSMVADARQQLREAESKLRNHKSTI